MELIQGQKQLSVREKSDIIIDAVFSGKEMEPFSVFNNGKEGTGKIYLTIHTPLDGLTAADLPFKWEPVVEEEQVVIHF